MLAADSRFPLSTKQLTHIVERVLAEAKSRGASAAETEVSEAFGESVTVRKNEIETIEYHRDKGITTTVYLGQQRGHASTADFTDQAIQAAVDKAITIARYTAPDDCSGLAEAHLLAKHTPDLELYHPWELSIEDAITLARNCEAAALAVDPRIKNSEGANVTTQEAQFVYANSHGFLSGYPSSRYSLSCSVIAEENQAMQRDHWYSQARDRQALQDAESVGKLAGQRTIQRLNARQLSTRQTPVIFEAAQACGLLAHFTDAVSGVNLYRKSSFLLDSLGRQVFSPMVSIREKPHLPQGLASAPFDEEGVATQDRDIVKAGVLQGYFLGSYSARKLGLQTTGNAGGHHNLILQSGSDDLTALLRRMGKGLLVTELLGQGVNPITGDYSRGAAGFWIEGGEIAYPVEEITIAGNLQQMFLDIVAIGNDIDRRSSRQCGSVWIANMTVAGN